MVGSDAVSIYFPLKTKPKKDAFMIPSTTDVQPMTYIPNPPMGQMNPLMMFALMKDGSSRSSDLALMMMMMGGQGK